MRYTTIIDITEIMEVYKNRNTRDLYIHMALKSGYHDTDRDIIRQSLRSMAAACGLTLSATRHSLSQLQKYHLVEKTADGWKVTKWVATITPTPRRQVKTTQTAIEDAERRRQQTDERERQKELEREEKNRLLEQGETAFTLYYKQKLNEAQNGDEEAAKIVKKREQQYRQELARIAELKKNKQT